MATAKATKIEREEAIEHLRTVIKPGDTVFTVLRHVSTSGMMRRISPIITVDYQGKCEPRDISHWVARVLGWTHDRDKGGIKVSGCGMDMGFHVVEALSSVLYGYDHGYDCLGAHACPSNWHQGENYGKVLPEGERHHDGYALSQRWI